MSHSLSQCSWSTSVGRPDHHTLPHRHEVQGRDLSRSLVTAQGARLENPEQATSQIPVTSERPDVSNATVQTRFRSTPEEAEQAEAKVHRTHANILFVGESNTSRSVLAEAIFRSLVAEAGLSESLQCESKGTRDYNIGDGPEASVRQAAEGLGISLPDVRARQFEPEKDIVVFDLVMVMDKYTAADVLKEVSVYDTISKGVQYTKRVRRLGEFHPELGPSKATDGQDIEDPLYGNVGGAEEQETVRQTASIIMEACQGLLAWLSQLQEAESAPSMKQAVKQAVLNMEATSWLTPPMLENL